MFYLYSVQSSGHFYVSSPPAAVIPTAVTKAVTTVLPPTQGNQAHQSFCTNEGISLFSYLNTVIREIRLCKKKRHKSKIVFNSVFIDTIREGTKEFGNVWVYILILSFRLFLYSIVSVLCHISANIYNN